MAGPRLRAFRARLIYGALVGVSGLGRRLPLRSAQRVGRILGSLAFWIARSERRKALANIAIAFPEWDSLRRHLTIRAMFRHLGMSVMEIAWLPKLTPALRERTTIVEGIDRVLSIIDSGRGVVIFTAHCGNWEWLAIATGLFGRPTSVLQRERDQPEMNRYITNVRAGAGVHSIDRGSPSSARDMMQILRRGGILAFLVDQNLRTESVQIPFFGHPVPTPIGPAKLATRAEALLVPAFTERLPDGRHRIVFGKPEQCRRADDPVALTARFTELVEAQVRRVPEQWVWMHDRWKARPKWDVTP